LRGESVIASAAKQSRIIEDGLLRRLRLLAMADYPRNGGIFNKVIAMDIRKVKKLIELLEESNCTELEIVEGEESVRISRAGTEATPVAMAPLMAAPVGAQHAAPSRDRKPFVERKPFGDKTFSDRKKPGSTKTAREPRFPEEFIISQ